MRAGVFRVKKFEARRLRKFQVFGKYKKQTLFTYVMLGYTHKNNDVFVFFESGELSRLGERKIQGNYINVNHPEVIGELECVVDEEICKKRMELIVTTTQRIPNGAVSSMLVSMMQRIYDALIERGRYELHEGYRHINLLDASRLDFSNESFYEDLKAHLARHSKPKT